MKLKAYITIIALAIFGATAFAAAPTVVAYDPLADACTSGSTSPICTKKGEKLEPAIAKITNTLLYIVGALSIVMIVFSGISYITSAGDSGRVAKAKNTLMYSVVGLIVALLAYAIVNWVVGLF